MKGKKWFLKKDARILSLALASLISTSLLIPSSVVVAQQDENLAKKMLSMYDKARGIALYLAKRAEGSGLSDVAEEIRRAVEKADRMINQAKERLESGEEKEAARLAKEAINTIREALIRLKEEQGLKVPKARRKGLIISRINRLREIIKRIEKSLKVLEKRGVNVEEPRKKLEAAEEMLKEAIVLINKGEFEQARNNVEGALKIIREVYSWIRSKISEIREAILRKRFQRIVTACERTLKRLKMIEERLIEMNRTKEAVKVAEARQKLTSSLDELKRALESEDFLAARKVLKEIINTLRTIREILVEHRSRLVAQRGVRGG